MTKTPITLQDLRRRLYVKAKAEPSWRFWGLYAHVCKPETRRDAYELAKQNDGAPGTDGVTFEAIDAEFCLAEGGGMVRTGGVVTQGNIGTTEKEPRPVELIARETAAARTQLRLLQRTSPRKAINLPGA
jgi:hypothetical protein